jgi:hypothetical protein
MQVKEAVELAKSHIKDLFGSEGVSNLGLEEVEFDDRPGEWLVTIGFSRPWDKPESTFAVLAQQLTYPKRTSKIVRIDDASGQVRSVRNREVK